MLTGYLEVVSGTRTGTACRLAESGQRLVGGSTESDLAVPEDSLLAPVHFAVELNNGRCKVRRSGHTAIYVNGRSVEESELRNGDMILAGVTMFSARLRPSSRSEKHAGHQVLDGKEDLFILLWATADAAIVPAIESAKASYVPISVEGKAQYAWLVSLREQPVLRNFLLDRGWGKRWGVYFVSESPMEELRTHLAAFLKIPRRDGTFTEFQVWDPGALAEFLPRCNEAAMKRFLGPARSVIFEGADPAVCMRFPEH